MTNLTWEEIIKENDMNYATFCEKERYVETLMQTLNESIKELRLFREQQDWKFTKDQLEDFLDNAKHLIEIAELGEK